MRDEPGTQSQTGGVIVRRCSTPLRASKPSVQVRLALRDPRTVYWVHALRSSCGGIVALPWRLVKLVRYVPRCCLYAMSSGGRGLVWWRLRGPSFGPRAAQAEITRRSRVRSRILLTMRCGRAVAVVVVVDGDRWRWLWWWWRW